VVDGAAGSTVALPGIQSIWIRDTITLNESGSVLSVSNTIVQVPEPDLLPATACLAGGSMLVAWLARRRRTRRSMPLPHAADDRWMPSRHADESAHPPIG
jgi:hypothetical protein